MFVVFTNANKITLTDDEILKIGEEKYLEFLWMVDGAFNSDKLKEDFVVNGKSLPKENRVFTCEYKKKSNECIGNNFEKEFNKLFASNIYYEDVYSDGIMYKWHIYEDGKHVFNVIDSCSVNRMGLDHKLSVNNVKDNEITYNVSFKNNNTDKEINKTFVLIFENNEWKVSKAYYYDLCEIKYYIK